MEDLSPAVSAHAGGAVLEVHAQPRASRTKLVGLHDGRLKIALAAPPVEGRANETLLRFLAEVLGVSKSDVRLVGGDSGRRKRVLVSGLGPAEVARRLGDLDAR